MDDVPAGGLGHVHEAGQFGVRVAPGADRVVAVEQRIHLKLRQVGAKARERVALVHEFSGEDGEWHR
jgi:hypothetical protein